MSDRNLEREELALRRRLLFRLLRGHQFDQPKFRTEAISETVRSGMIAPGLGLFGASAERRTAAPRPAARAGINANRGPRNLGNSRGPHCPIWSASPPGVKGWLPEGRIASMRNLNM